MTPITPMLLIVVGIAISGEQRSAHLSFAFTSAPFDIKSSTRDMFALVAAK
jgi:hypothetical protein